MISQALFFLGSKNVETDLLGVWLPLEPSHSSYRIAAIEEVAGWCHAGLWVLLDQEGRQNWEIQKGPEI